MGGAQMSYFARPTPVESTCDIESSATCRSVAADTRKIQNIKMLWPWMAIVLVWGIAQAERGNQRTSLPDSEATENLRRQSTGGRFRQPPFRPHMFRDESSFNPNFLRDAGSSFRPNFPMKGPMTMGEGFDEGQFSFPMRQSLRSPMMGFIPGDGLRSASFSGGNSMGMKDSNLFAMPSNQFVPFRMPQNGLGNTFTFPVRSFPTTFFNMPFQAVAVTPFKVAADDEDDAKDLTSTKTAQSPTKAQGLKSAVSELPITSSSVFNPMFSGFPMQNAMMMSPAMSMAAFNGGESLRSASGGRNRVPTKLKLVPEGALRHGPPSEGPNFQPDRPMRRPQGFRPSGPEFEGLRSAGMSGGDFRPEEFEAMSSQQRPFRRPEFPVRSAFPGPGFEEEAFRGSEQQFRHPENFPMSFSPNMFPSHHMSQSLKAASPMREEALKSAPSSLTSSQSFSSSSGMKFRPVGMAPIQFTSSSGVSQENLKAALPSSGFDASSMTIGDMNGFSMMPMMNNMAMPFRPIMLRPVKLVPSSHATKSASSSSKPSSSVADDVRSRDKDADDMDLEPMATKNHESLVRSSDLEDFEATQFDEQEQQQERPKFTKAASHKLTQYRRPVSHSAQHVNKEEYPQSHRSYSSFYAASYPHGYKGASASHSATKSQHRGQNHYYIPQPHHEDGAEQHSKQAAQPSSSQASYSTTSHRQQPHSQTSSSYVEIKMKPSQHKSASSKSEYEDSVPSYDSQYKSQYADDDTRSRYSTRYADDQSSQQKSAKYDNREDQYKARYESDNTSQYKDRMDSESSPHYESNPQYDYTYYKTPANSEISYTDSYLQATPQTLNTRSFDDTTDTETLEATS